MGKSPHAWCLVGYGACSMLISVNLCVCLRKFTDFIDYQAGQNCIGIELVLVHRSAYDKLISKLLPRIKALRLGTDVGSLISSTPIPRLQELIEQSVSQGATLLAGGKHYDHPNHPGASYFQPTLLGNVKMDMEVAKNELFAPVMSVVAYDRVDEAIDMLNKSRFGLGAGVYGENKKECMSVAASLQCGMVAINEYVHPFSVLSR